MNAKYCLMHHTAIEGYKVNLCVYRREGHFPFTPFGLCTSNNTTWDLIYTLCDKNKKTKVVVSSFNATSGLFFTQMFFKYFSGLPCCATVFDLYYL